MSAAQRALCAPQGDSGAGQRSQCCASRAPTAPAPVPGLYSGPPTDPPVWGKEPHQRQSDMQEQFVVEASYPKQPLLPGVQRDTRCQALLHQMRTALFRLHVCQVLDNLALHVPVTRDHNNFGEMCMWRNNLAWPTSWPAACSIRMPSSKGILMVSGQKRNGSQGNCARMTSRSAAAGHALQVSCRSLQPCLLHYQILSSTTHQDSYNGQSSRVEVSISVRNCNPILDGTTLRARYNMLSSTSTSSITSSVHNNRRQGPCIAHHNAAAGQ